MDFKTRNIFESEERKDMKKMKKVLETNVKERINRMKELRTEKRLQKSLQEQKDNPQLDKEEEVKQGFISLILDDETGLPFEQGFDELILHLKEQRKSKDQSRYLQKVNAILRDLEVASEEDLTLLYSGAIAKSQSHDYMEKARGVVVAQLIRIIKTNQQQQTTQDQTILDRFLQGGQSNQEFILQEYDNMEQNLDFSQYLEQKVDKNQLEGLATLMAKEAIETEAISSKTLHKQLRKEEREQGDLYLGYDNVIKNDPLLNHYYSGENEEEFYYALGIRGQQEPQNVQDMDDHQYQMHSIYRKITRRYFQQKIQYLEGLQQKQQEQHQQKKVHKIEREDFFQMDWSDHYIQNNDSYQRLIQEPNMTNIYSNVDYLITNMNEQDFIQHKMKEDNKHQNIRFSPSFVSRHLDHSQLLWQSFRDNFTSITNQAYLRTDFNSEQRQSIEDTKYTFSHERELDEEEIIAMNRNKKTLNRDLQQLNQQLEGDGQISQAYLQQQAQEDTIETIIKSQEVYDIEEKQSEQDKVDQGFQSHRGETATTLDLAPHQQTELEVLHSIKATPFFTHHLRNAFQYFAERNQDTNHLLANRYLLSNPKEQQEQIKQHQKYEQVFYKSQQEQGEEEQEQVMGKLYGFGKGTRKACNCLAVVKPGTGKVTVNHLPFIHYFPVTYQRIGILKPVEIARKSGEIDINFHVRGGGSLCQPEAARLALAKALVMKFPESKYDLKHTGNLYTDPRQVERKKQGLLKARKRPPYIRR